MFRDAGRCQLCGRRLRWEWLPPQPDGGMAYLALRHGDETLGSARLDALFDGADEQVIATWVARHHRGRTEA